MATKISSNAFKPGMTIIINNDVCQLLKVVHVNPGRGSAFVRTRIKDLESQSVVEKTFRAAEKVPQAIVTDRTVQYLYKGSAGYVFMDMKTYEQTTVPEANIKSALKYLKANMQVTLVEYENKVLGIKLPNTVTLTVAKTQPTIKGNTASGGGKPATMTTGLKIQVPFFIKNGDKLVINTQQGKYISRADK